MKTFNQFFTLGLAFSLIIILGGLFFSCATAPPPEPEAEVPPAAVESQEEPEPQPSDAPSTPWPGKARAAVSLTFDDGTLDHYTTVFPILKEYGLRGTFFLIAGRVGQEFWQDGRVKRPLLNWNHAREMVAAGQEMGTQGFNHRNMLGAWKKVDNAELVEVEFRQAKQKIEEEVKSPVEFFAWPYWQTPKEGIAPGLEVYKLLRSGVFLEEEYYRRYGPDPMMPGEPGKLLSFAPIAPEDPKAWERISDWVKQREGWLILCFHGITPSNTNGQQVSGWEPIEEGRFRNILKTLIAEEDIWVAPMGEVFRHIQASRN